MNDIFKKNEFSIQIISSGAFLDNDPGYRGKVYLVETFVIRLNHIALNEWLLVQARNYRDHYETEQEWQDYLAQKEIQLQAFNDKVAAAVGCDPSAGSITITQALSEIFTVVNIQEAK